MSTTTVGEFEVSVSGPYPCWVEIKHKRTGGKGLCFPHSELSNIQHAVSIAMREADMKLLQVNREGPSEVYLK